MATHANPVVTISESTLGGVTFSETLHAPGSRLAPHAHPFANLCVVRRGGFRERWRQGSAEQRTGDVIFRAADDEHANVFLDAGARCFNVTLAAGMTDGLGLRAPRVVLAGRRIRAMLARLHREVASAQPSPLVAEGLVYQVLGEAFQRRDPGLAWLERVREEIAARYDQPLSVTGLAALVGVHPAHLSRAFHRRFGSPVLAFIRETRVRAAADLLRRSSLSLADVAAGSGFADQSHLTRVFKRSTGLTPARYRRDRP